MNKTRRRRKKPFGQCETLRHYRAICRCDLYIHFFFYIILPQPPRAVANCVSVSGYNGGFGSKIGNGYYIVYRKHSR